MVTNHLSRTHNTPQNTPQLTVLERELYSLFDEYKNGIFLAQVGKLYSKTLGKDPPSNIGDAVQKLRGVELRE